MKALFLYGLGDIRLRDVNVPEINDNEILLKVKSSALCGSDIRMINNGYIGVNEASPRIIGHEFSGVIAKTGKNVKTYTVGTSVCIAPNMGCGRCDMCVGGNSHLCKDYRAFGINIDGGFAEYVRIPEEAVRQGNLVEKDAQISFEEAALNEPLSCVYNGFTKCDVRQGDYVLVIGAGPIGMMHTQLAKRAGAAKVLLNDLSVERLELCKTIDKALITVGPESLKDNVYKLTQGKGVDVCIIACPSPLAQAESLELVNIGGRINFFGGLPSGSSMVSIDTNLIHYKQLIITGSTRASISHYRKTLMLISQGLVNVKEMITSSYTLDELYNVLNENKRIKGLKTVVNFN